MRGLAENGKMIPKTPTFLKLPVFICEPPRLPTRVYAWRAQGHKQHNWICPGLHIFKYIYQTCSLLLANFARDLVFFPLCNYFKKEKNEVNSLVL